MNRKEHLQWCKDRALEYVETNDLQNALVSMAVDLQKHKETKDHSGIEIGMLMLMGRMLSTPLEMHDFINGFN